MKADDIQGLRSARRPELVHVVARSKVTSRPIPRISLHSRRESHHAQYWLGQPDSPSKLGHASLRDGGFSAEFSVEEHDESGVTETQFYVRDTFPTQESAIKAAIQAGRQKIDVGFERGSAVVNG